MRAINTWNIRINGVERECDTEKILLCHEALNDFLRKLEVLGHDVGNSAFWHDSVQRHSSNKDAKPKENE